MTCPPFGIECVDYGSDIVDSGIGSIRIPAVGDNLHIGRSPGKQSTFEVLIDLNHEQTTSLIDQAFRSCGAFEIGDPVEHSRSVQRGQQLR